MKNITSTIVALAIIASIATAQSKSASGEKSKSGQKQSSPSSEARASGGRDRTGSGDQRQQPFSPSLKFSNLNLLDGTKDFPGPAKTLVLAWNVTLSNEFAGNITNKVTAQTVELRIQKSKGGLATVTRSVPTTTRDFSFIIQHQSDESVTVNAIVRAECTISGAGQITLSDTGQIRRDPPAAGAGDVKKVDVTILSITQEEMKSVGRGVPFHIKWKTKSWDDAKLISLIAELSTSNSDGSTTKVKKMLGLSASEENLLLSLPAGVFAREYKLKITAICRFTENGRSETATSEAVKAGTLRSRI